MEKVIEFPKRSWIWKMMLRLSKMDGLPIAQNRISFEWAKEELKYIFNF